MTVPLRGKFFDDSLRAATHASQQIRLTRTPPRTPSSSKQVQGARNSGSCTLWNVRDH
jgi:hypothetical protein